MTSRERDQLAAQTLVAQAPGGKIVVYRGEIAALTGTVRTANIITEEESEFLIIPSKVLKSLTGNYDGLRQMFQTTATERLHVVGAPRGMGMDQELLRDLRTTQLAMETEPATM